MPKIFIDDGYGIWFPPAKLSDEEANAKWIEHCNWEVQFNCEPI
jgi:hypothetical protein